MNTRCYRCGRSFTIGREAIEAAAVSSAGQKFHVVYCPNCRTAIKMPMEQVMRELPPGWQPVASAADGAAKTTAEAPAGETITPTEPGSEIVAVVVGVHKSHRRHRRAKSPDAQADAPAAAAAPAEEPPLPKPILEAPATELEAPEPKRTRKRKVVAEDEAAPAAAKAPKHASAAKKSAAAAKKTARKRATPKKE